MKTNDQLREFLETATAGLRDDRELQLDVRAELASHLEDKAAELEESGKSPDEALELARESFGTVADVAADLIHANQRRMRWHGRTRLALRILLVPIAVIVAAAFSDLPQIAAMSKALHKLGSSEELAVPFESLLGHFARSGKRLTATEKLILYGDANRKTMAEQQRAIWEAFPENRAYLGNYITQLAWGFGPNHPQLEQNLATLEGLLPTAREIDPDNARLLVLHAAGLLSQACEFTQKDPWAETSYGKPPWRTELIIKDRRTLDTAMAELAEALEKPAYRRYSQEMLRERLRILGPPRTALGRFHQIYLAEAVRLPDLSLARNLADVSIRYGELLAGEGQMDRAGIFLDAWQPLAIHLNADAYTLIDSLVVCALIGTGHKHSSEVYERLSDTEAAERTRVSADVLGGPINRWHAAAASLGKEETPERAELKAQAGALAETLAFGSWRDNNIFPDMLTYGRLTDYVLAEKAVVSITSALLLLAVLVSFGVGWWWRLVSMPRKRIDSILLMPDWRKMGRCLAFGVILPVAAYAVYTRWLPLDARAYSLQHAWPRAALEMATLVFVVLTVTMTMAGKAVHERCLVLGLATPTLDRSRLMSLT